MVPFSDQPRSTEEDKMELRKAINRRAKNQIVRSYLSSQALDPNFYSAIVHKVSHQENLIQEDINCNCERIDSTVLLLLVTKQICASTISMIETLKAKASDLKVSEHNHDVALVVTKFEEYVERINSHGRKWDDATSELFKVLGTCEDEQFKTAIGIKESKFLAGQFTDLNDLSSYAIAIYTNQHAKGKWMVPDAKTAKIAALVTQVESLQKSITDKGTSLAYTTNVATNNSKNNQIADWRYKHTGSDKITKDDKTWYWCDHSSHGRKNSKCTDGLYCLTHGRKGHPEHDHDSWINYKKNNPYGKKKPSASDTSSASTKSEGKIALNDKLRSALLTRTSCTVEDLEALVNEDF